MSSAGPGRSSSIKAENDGLFVADVDDGDDDDDDDDDDGDDEGLEEVGGKTWRMRRRSGKARWSRLEPRVKRVDRQSEV